MAFYSEVNCRKCFCNLTRYQLLHGSQKSGPTHFIIGNIFANVFLLSDIYIFLRFRRLTQLLVGFELSPRCSIVFYSRFTIYVHTFIHRGWSESFFPVPQLNASALYKFKCKPIHSLSSPETLS